MKNTAKLIVITIFALGALFTFLSSNGLSTIGAAVFSDASAQPTPPKKKGKTPTNTPTATATSTNTPTPAATPATVPANTASNTSTAPTSGGKKIPKDFTLGRDSQSEYGEAPFDHDNHAFKNYSPDGKSVVGCVECHHTDQPKSALKSPLVTSERDVILTIEVWQKSNQKVSGCRDCHFQDGNVPDGKTMPTIPGKDDLDNRVAYHINCNTCHDAAHALRKDIKARNKTFATSRDCAVCHKVN